MLHYSFLQNFSLNMKAKLHCLTYLCFHNSCGLTAEHEVTLHFLHWAFWNQCLGHIQYTKSSLKNETLIMKTSSITCTRSKKSVQRMPFHCHGLQCTNTTQHTCTHTRTQSCIITYCFGFEGRLNFLVLQFFPVHVAEESVFLNVSFSLRSTAQTLPWMLGHQLPTCHSVC